MADQDNYWLRRRISRRGALRGSALAGVAAASYALVGCGDDDDADDEATPTAGIQPTAGASPTTAKQPVPGGSFSFQMPAIPPSLDPYTQTSFQNAYVNGLSYSKLLRFAAGVPAVDPADNTMEPDLAQKLPEQPDELTYTFKLKPGIKFHNGRAMTSEDVLYAFDRYLNFEKSVHKTGLAFTDKITAPDANTVQITTKSPYADTVSYLGGNLGAWISPKEHAESAEATTKMVGTGPFIMTELQTGVSIKFKKNPDYYDKPYPYFDDLTAFGVSDRRVRNGGSARRRP